MRWWLVYATGRHATRVSSNPRPPHQQHVPALPRLPLKGGEQAERGRRAGRAGGTCVGAAEHQIALTSAPGPMRGAAVKLEGRLEAGSGGHGQAVGNGGQAAGRCLGWLEGVTLGFCSYRRNPHPPAANRWARTDPGRTYVTRCGRLGAGAWGVGLGACSRAHKVRRRLSVCS
jgi:hypothetical protein